ncbi:E3 ubiquitin-protein ligase At3g02290-like [Carica papaya]|uniref:E3 ubiquitin-protein ligase At3g02290-like n=1 Tax=Carica papaya TaxID=3649 RepID=UPI000B8CA862|nr:E3 ubiquitin-protein ligase At3g02290-like [Carica papaya]
MGAVCCCLHDDSFEDYMNPNNPVYRNCLCLSCFVQNFLNVYASLFRRGEVHSVPSSIQGYLQPLCTEYTPENPKIMTKCSHHFHLGCIYEWMERSDSCPVCGKVMVFDETT